MHALAQQVKNAQMRFPCRAAASAIEYRRRTHTHTLVHKHTPLFSHEAELCFLFCTAGRLRIGSFAHTHASHTRESIFCNLILRVRFVFHSTRVWFSLLLYCFLQVTCAQHEHTMRTIFLGIEIIVKVVSGCFYKEKDGKESSEIQARVLISAWRYCYKRSNFFQENLFLKCSCVKSSQRLCWRLCYKEFNWATKVNRNGPLMV
jgi:hypothetical protein